ncbi:MAG: HD-GYP domain-containing protein [Candidatus Brocadiia bacterium]
MDASEKSLRRDVGGAARHRRDDARRIEDFVAEHVEARRAEGSAGHLPAPPAAPHAPVAMPPAALAPARAPRVVASLRRRLHEDPLRALDMAYPAALLGPGAEAEAVRRELLVRHSVHTACLALHVAEAHGFQPSTVEVVGLCALLHDVGLERVSAELFAKSEPLTSGEREVLRGHAAEGAELLRCGGQLEGLLRRVVPAVVRQHHERADGSGYPDGLGAAHTHEFARLLALAEAYETMVSPRPYKQAVLPHEAMEALVLDAFGKLGPPRFDKRMAASFLRALGLYPVGSGVRLESGEIALVVASHWDEPDRPYVRLLTGREGRPLERPRVVDLHAAGIAVARAVALPSPLAAPGKRERGSEPPAQHAGPAGATK